MSTEIPISSLDESPWLQYLALSETQLYHFYEPKPGLFIAESPNVISRALSAGYLPKSFLIDRQFYSRFVREMTAQHADIPVYLADQTILNSIPGLHLTRGVLCAMQRKNTAFSPALLAAAQRIAVLENIMNPTNLGAVFRSAAALGIDAVLLTAGCTDPLYRRAARVSMGTVFQVPWYTLPDAATAVGALKILKAIGFRSAAMALCDDSVSIDEPCLQSTDKLAIILGTEGDGLAAETIRACDWTVRIPMAHGVDSLNVAAASAVAFWELRKR